MPWAELRQELLDSVRLSDRWEKLVEGNSRDDVIHDVMTELYKKHKDGEQLPSDRDGLVALATKMYRRRWATLCQRGKERSKKRDLHSATLASDDLFSSICARNEQLKLFSRIFEASSNDPELKLFLYTLLKFKVPFEETAEMAELLGCSSAAITNIKRRLKRLVKQQSEVLLSSSPSGEDQ